MVRPNDMPEHKWNQKPVWSRWFIATLLGTIIGSLLLSLVLIRLPGDTDSNWYVDLLQTVTTTTIVILPISIGQWFVLRRYLYRAGRWILASVTATVICLPAVQSIVRAGGDPELATLVALYGVGVFTGLTQWFVLRGTIRNSIWWVLVSALSWLLVTFLLGIMIHWLSIGLDPILKGLAGFLHIVAIWSIYGAIMGLVLKWLLQQAGAKSIP